MLFRSKLNDLKKYEKPYQGKDFIGSQRGTLDPITGAPGVLVRITEEHLELAKRYLHTEDVYICFNTVSQTISKIVNGQITAETIEEKESKIKKLEGLKKKDETKQA